MEYERLSRLSSPPSQSSRHSPLRVNSRLNVLVCTVCRGALAPNLRNVEQHVHHHHASEDSQAFDAWRRAFERLDTSNLFSNHKQACTFGRHPPYDSDILVRWDGLRCLECDAFVTPSRETIKKHLRTVHGQSASEYESRFSPRQSISRLFIMPNNTWYPVDPPRRAARPSNLRAGDDLAFEHALHTARVERAMVSRPEGRDQTLFLKRTGWDEHFAGLNMRVVCAAAAVPADERGEILRRACRSLVWRCHDDAQLEQPMVKRAIRSVSKELWSKELKPLTSVTLENYAGLWCQMLSYLLTVAADPSAHNLSLTSEQVRLIERLDEEVEGARRAEPQLQSSLDGFNAVLLRPKMAPAAHEQVKDAIFDLSLELVRQQVPADPFVSPLVHFVGVIGFDAKACHWREAHLVRPYLSRLTYVMRLVVLRSATEPPPPPSLRLHAVEQATQKFLWQSCPTPFQEIFLLSMDIKSKHEGHYKVPNYSLSLDRRLLSFESLDVLDVHKLASVPKIELDAAEALICRLAFHASRHAYLESRRPEPIFDPLNFSTSMESFVDQEVNSHLDLRGGWRRIRDRCLNEGPHEGPAPIRRDAGAAGDEVGLDVSAAIEWLDAEAQLLDRILFLVATVAGAPARGTELSSLTIRNTRSGRRSMFVYEGLVCLIASYSKTESLTGAPKLIPRFLPYRLSRLLIAHVADVVPFREWLNWLLSDGGELNASPFLFVRKEALVDTSHITAVLRDTFERHLNCGIGMQQWRQLSIVIDKEFLRSEERLGREQRRHAGNTLQAGHGEHVESHNYAVASPFGDAVSVTHQSLAAFRTVSRLWHAFFDLDSDFPANVRHAVDPAVAQIFERVTRVSASPSQSSTSPSTAQSDGPAAGSRKRKRRGSSTPERRVDGDLSPLEVLRFVYQDPLARFRDGQGEAIEAVLAREPGKDVLVKLPPACGKSDVILIPAYMHRSLVSVVVTPTIALKVDFRRRCAARGVECREWTPEASGECDANIVLVTPERSTNDAFRTWLFGLKAHGRLGWIFLDECTVLDDGGWRRGVNDMHWLRDETLIAGVPRVFLSGTLAPETERRIAVKFNVRPDRLKRVERPTIRLDVHTSVIPVPKHRLESHLRTLLTDQRRRSAKTVLFVRHITEVERRATELAAAGHDAFRIHGQLSDEDKARAVADFDASTHGVLVTTSIFTYGVNVGNLTLVLALGAFLSLAELLQSFNRAGRNGEDSKAVLLLDDADPVLASPRAATPSSSGGEAVRRFVQTTDCRFTVASEMMGESVEVACDPGRPRCDNCEDKAVDLRTAAASAFPSKPRQLQPPHSSRSSPPRVASQVAPAAAPPLDVVPDSAEPSSAIISSSPPRASNGRRSTDDIGRRRLDGEYQLAFSRIADCMDATSPSCMLCWLSGSDGHVGHNTEDCVHLPRDTDLIGSFKAVREEVKKVKNVACWRCLGPSRRCMSKDRGTKAVCGQVSILTILAAAPLPRYATVFEEASIDPASLADSQEAFARAMLDGRFRPTYQWAYLWLFVRLIEKRHEWFG